MHNVWLEHFMTAGFASVPRQKGAETPPCKIFDSSASTHAGGTTVEGSSCEQELRGLKERYANQAHEVEGMRKKLLP